MKVKSGSVGGSEKGPKVNLNNWNKLTTNNKKN